MLLNSSKLIKTNLADKVADIFRRRILDGTLLPDEHLNEVTIATELGLSRGPVRDAIKILENEGLAYTPSNGRTVVNGFSEGDLLDFDMLRFYLESDAIKRVIAMSYEDESYDRWLENLEQTLISMKENLNLKKKSTDDFDLVFHENIMVKANNKINLRVWKSMIGIRTTLMEINRKLLGQEENLTSEMFYEFHELIFKGLQERNLELAIDNLKKHTDWGTKIYDKMIKTMRRNGGR